ncbi:MAG: 50S ribosomal protein L22 [Candidatus Dojkabacteria bacterium]|jgi:large subunit ribosomal protein L22
MKEKIVTVKVKNIAQSPLKLRLVVDLVRGKNAQEALEMLDLLNKKGALIVKKAILSGVANAKELHSVDAESLEISKITVDEARILKRTRFESRGRVSRIDKRRSHINLELTVK